MYRRVAPWSFHEVDVTDLSQIFNNKSDLSCYSIQSGKWSLHFLGKQELDVGRYIDWKSIDEIKQKILSIDIIVIVFKVTYYLIWPQIQKGDPRTPIPPCVMASSAMELQLGVFRFLPTTPMEINAKKMRTRYAPDESRLFWAEKWWGKSEYPNWSPCWDNDGAESGISGLYLWLWHIIIYMIQSCQLVRSWHILYDFSLKIRLYTFYP